MSMYEFKDLINQNIKQKIPNIKSTLANNMMSGFEYQIAAPWFFAGSFSSLFFGSFSTRNLHRDFE